MNSKCLQSSFYCAVLSLKNSYQTETPEDLGGPCPSLSPCLGCGECRWLGASLSGCALEGSFSHPVDGGEAEGSRSGSCRCDFVTPRSEAECYQKVASSAIALQSDGNTPRSPEVKECLSGERRLWFLEIE